MRTWDAIKIGFVIEFMLAKDQVIDPIEWLSDSTHIVLENEYGDLALFEYAFVDKKLYSAHYYFKSRGRQAIIAARGFLNEFFNTCYNVNVVMGLTPVDNRPARWINRQMGCTSYGFEEIHEMEYELFIITKKEFNDG